MEAGASKRGALGVMAMLLNLSFAPYPLICSFSISLLDSGGGGSSFWLCISL